MPGHPFYGSVAWKKARAATLKRAKGCCQACGTSVSGKGQARVDHIKPRQQHPELALEPTNLRALCVPCDALRHAHKGSGGKAGVWEDKRGTDAKGYPTSPHHPWNRRAS